MRVRNACSAAFEAAVSEVRDPTERGYGLDWTQIPSGSSEHMVMATETTEAVFVWLRAADADTIPTPVRKVINPTGRWQDAEDEVTIVVLDKECPQA